jgi:hypothetical protein
LAVTFNTASFVGCVQPGEQLYNLLVHFFGIRLEITGGGQDERSRISAPPPYSFHDSGATDIGWRLQPRLAMISPDEIRFGFEKAYSMAQRIVYLSWPAGEITGGIKMVFRHVEVLREAGFDAVVATADAVPPAWFQSTAPVINLNAVVNGEDVLVFPENHHALLNAYAAWRNRKIVFCQSWSMAFRGVGTCRDYSDFGVSELLCVDPFTARFCQLRFPRLPVSIVPVYIDREQFHMEVNKKVQVAFAPRKRPLEVAFVHDLFQTMHPEFRNVPWVQIDGLTESQVASTLRETAVYLSLCRMESCPLTILEAFSCGCVTVGFTGIGGRQFTTMRNGFWAEEDDCIDCAEKLAEAVRLVTQGGARCSDMLEAIQTTARLYSRERMARRLVEVWRGFLAREAAAATNGQ